MIPRQQGRELAAVAQEAEADLLAGSSLKAALDRDWDDPAEREAALVRVLATLEAVERFLAQGPPGAEQPRVAEALAIYGKAWPVRHGDRYAKTAFVLDFDRGTIRCPNQVRISFQVGQTVRFPDGRPVWRLSSAGAVHDQHSGAEHLHPS